MISESIFACLATLGFGILFNIRGKRLFWAALGGGLSWFFYLLIFKLTSYPITSFFVATVLVATYAEIMAYILKTPVTTFIICSIIPLVPGGGMFNTLLGIVQGKNAESLANGIKTLAVAGAIAIGVFFVSMIAKLFSSKKTLSLENK